MNSQHKPARKIPDLPAKKKTNVPLDPHTKSFLKVLRMEKYAATFQNEEIDKAVLLLIEEEDLEQLVSDVEDRKIFWAAVKGEETPLLSQQQQDDLKVILSVRGQREICWERVHKLFSKLEDKLVILQDHFCTPISRMSLEPNSVVNDRAVDSVFFRIPIMLNLSREFCETHDLQVGQTLINLMHMYIRNLETAVMTLFTLEQNHRFRETLKDMEAENEGHTLVSMLSFPSYCARTLDVLFNELILHQDPARDDVKMLQTMFNLASEMQKDCHGSSTAIRAQEELFHWTMTLSGCPNLCSVGRNFLKQGTLSIYRGSKIETFHAFLFSDCLILTSQRPTDLVFIYKETITFHLRNSRDSGGSRSAPTHLVVERLNGTNDFSIIVDICIRLVSTDKTQPEGAGVFYLSSEDEVEEWITMLKKVTISGNIPSPVAIRKKSGSFLKSLKIKSPRTRGSPRSSPRQGSSPNSGSLGTTPGSNSNPNSPRKFE